MKYVTSEFEHVKVVYPVDCGNAPRKLLLKDFHIAVVQNDSGFISEHLMEDCHWEIIGREQIAGKENMIRKIDEIASIRTSKLLIKHIITHGKTTSIHGDLTMENGDTYAFCHIHIFSSAGKQAKIKETTSYIIET